MTRRTRIITRTLCLTLSAVLSAGIFTTASAAGAPPAAAPTAADPSIDQVQELDEIMVRGKRLRDAIADAEDDFFALYNKLNKDDDYSTSCVYVNLDPDSQIKSRMCIPGFMADALADQVYFQQQCQSSGQDENGNDYPPPPCYTPPPPQVVLTQRSKDYANNMLKVIRTDERLGKMAGNLDNLYMELLQVQQQYVKAKSVEVQNRTREPAKTTRSPRN
jgi:septum formation topological specificity factor MinE